MAGVVGQAASLDHWWHHEMNWDSGEKSHISGFDLGTTTLRLSLLGVLCATREIRSVEWLLRVLAVAPAGRQP